MSHRKGKKPENRKNQVWTKQEEQKLKKLATTGNNPTGIIADLMGRSKNSIYSKASDVGVSLKPVNRSPYSRRKKK